MNCSTQTENISHKIMIFSVQTSNHLYEKWGRANSTTSQCISSSVRTFSLWKRSVEEKDEEEEEKKTTEDTIKLIASYKD